MEVQEIQQDQAHSSLGNSGAFLLDFRGVRIGASDACEAVVCGDSKSVVTHHFRVALDAGLRLLSSPLRSSFREPADPHSLPNPRVLDALGAAAKRDVGIASNLFGRLRPRRRRPPGHPSNHSVQIVVFDYPVRKFSPANRKRLLAERPQ
jgi:hypothetical protein